MPVYSDYYDDEQFPAPPNVPPPNGGGGAPAPSGSFQTWAPTQTPTSGGGGGGSYTPPVRPQFQGVNIPGAPKFEVKPFVAPDKNTLLSDPGYLARVQSGQDALERSAAAKGWLRTGGHGQQLVDYAENSGSQEYGAAYNRGRDIYDRYYQGQKDAYAPLFARWQQQADANKQAGLLGYQTDLNFFLQQNQPHYSPEPDLSWLLNGDDFGGGGQPPPSAPSAPQGYEDDPRRRPQYDY